LRIDCRSLPTRAALRSEGRTSIRVFAPLPARRVLRSAFWVSFRPGVASRAGWKFPLGSTQPRTRVISEAASSAGLVCPQPGAVLARKRKKRNKTGTNLTIDSLGLPNIVLQRRHSFGGTAFTGTAFTGVESQRTPKSSLRAKGEPWRTPEQIPKDQSEMLPALREWVFPDTRRARHEPPRFPSSFIDWVCASRNTVNLVARHGGANFGRQSSSRPLTTFHAPRSSNRISEAEILGGTMAGRGKFTDIRYAVVGLGHLAQAAVVDLVLRLHSKKQESGTSGTRRTRGYANGPRYL
jgi:hypothetical protein